MKKITIFALLMTASIGVFANQKTYSDFKGIAISNVKISDYQDIVSVNDLTEADNRKTVSAESLTKVDNKEVVSTSMLLCGESGPITNMSGTEVVGYWYTTCVEPEPPFEKHYIFYEK